MRIGFIGTGTMGTPIAGCLIAAGHRLTVYDTRPEAMGALIGHGAATADSPSEAAYGAGGRCSPRCRGRARSRPTALDPDRGIFAGLRRGGTYIDLTTNAPATVRLVAEAARKRDVAFLDAPVSGRPPNMTVMVGGDAKPISPIAGRCSRRSPQTSSMSGRAGRAAPPSWSRNISATPISSPRSKACWSPPRPASTSASWRRSCRSAPARAAPSTTSPRAVLNGLCLRRHARHRRQGHGPRGVIWPARSGRRPRSGALASDIYKRAQAQGWGGEGFPSVARILEAMAGVEIRAERRDD